MRLLIQRVRRASVSVNGACIGSIDHGLLVFVGVGLNDTPEDVTYLASKLLKLRIFEDNQGRTNRSLAEVSGSVLVVSQFTLYGDFRKGNRPRFTAAALPEVGERLYHEFLKALRELGTDPESGRFGADMQVELLNEGPMTLWIESEGR
ncbi:MAG: D-aminoacyl-tRNA deacylase [Pontiellaceae bacterium]